MRLILLVSSVFLMVYGSDECITLYKRDLTGSDPEILWNITAVGPTRGKVLAGIIVVRANYTASCNGFLGLGGSAEWISFKTANNINLLSFSFYDEKTLVKKDNNEIKQITHTEPDNYPYLFELQIKTTRRGNLVYSGTSASIDSCSEAEALGKTDYIKSVGHNCVKYDSIKLCPDDLPVINGPKIAELGTLVVLTCSVPVNKHSLQITWGLISFEGKKLDYGFKETLPAGKLRSELSIPSFSNVSVGKYWCIKEVKDLHGTFSKNFTVYDKPVLVSAPNFTMFTTNTTFVWNFTRWASFEDTKLFYNNIHVPQPSKAHARAGEKPGWKIFTFNSGQDNVSKTVVTLTCSAETVYSRTFKNKENTSPASYSSLVTGILVGILCVAGVMVLVLCFCCKGKAKEIFMEGLTSVARRRLVMLNYTELH